MYIICNIASGKICFSEDLTAYMIKYNIIFIDEKFQHKLSILHKDEMECLLKHCLPAILYEI